MKKLLLLTTLLASMTAWGECVEGNCSYGQGTAVLDNGDKYIGEFQGNTRHGQGTYTWANGDKYVGEFRNNKRHGLGVYTFADGETKTGVSENGTYFGTKAAWDVKVERERAAREEAERERKAKAERERVAREEAKKKYDRIYNACLLDKSSGVDMQVTALRRAVEEMCEAIAADPSWYEELKYN